MRPDRQAADDRRVITRDMDDLQRVADRVHSCTAPPYNEERPRQGLTGRGR